MPSKIWKHIPPFVLQKSWEKYSDGETIELEPLKNKPFAGGIISDHDNEHALIHTALGSYWAELVNSMDACPLE